MIMKTCKADVITSRLVALWHRGFQCLAVVLSWLLAQQFQSSEVRSVFSQQTRAGTQRKGPHTNPSPTFPFITFLWGGDFLHPDHTLAVCVSLILFKWDCVHVHVLGHDKLLICDILDVLFQLLTASCVVTFSCPIEIQSECDSFNGSGLCISVFFDCSAFFSLHVLRASRKILLILLSENFPAH